jgi:hypothetical protein
MTEHQELAQLLERCRSAPSIMADAILKSDWLKDHDEQVRANAHE